MQTGAALGLQYGGSRRIAIALAGAVFGALLVAVLAPVGSRTGVPSMIAARAPLGYRGAQIVSGLLYLTNFAWIAINNQIAASACAQVLGGPDSAASGPQSSASPPSSSSRAVHARSDTRIASRCRSWRSPAAS